MITNHSSIFHLTSTLLQGKFKKATSINGRINTWGAKQQNYISQCEQTCNLVLIVEQKAETAVSLCGMLHYLLERCIFLDGNWQVHSGYEAVFQPKTSCCEKSPMIMFNAWLSFCFLSLYVNEFPHS